MSFLTIEQCPICVKKSFPEVSRLGFMNLYATVNVHFILNLYFTYGVFLQVQNFQI